MTRRFELHRDTDASGVVADGVEFPSGRVVLTWLAGKRPAMFDCIETVEARSPLTRIVWV